MMVVALDKEVVEAEVVMVVVLDEVDVEVEVDVAPTNMDNNIIRMIMKMRPTISIKTNAIMAFLKTMLTQITIIVRMLILTPYVII